MQTTTKKHETTTQPHKQILTLTKNEKPLKNTEKNAKGTKKHENHAIKAKPHEKNNFSAAEESDDIPVRGEKSKSWAAFGNAPM